MIVGKLGFPHVITNEDGVKFDHPGYVISVCSLCGTLVTHVIGLNVSYCGWDECIKREKDFKRMMNA